MTAHGWHPREGHVNAPVLFDDCARCREHAEHRGLDLDADKFALAWQQMVKVEKGTEGHALYRSENEARLCGYLYQQALILERFMGINPWGWPPSALVEFVR